jgi:hypothetical protein
MGTRTVCTILVTVFAFASEPATVALAAKGGNGGNHAQASSPPLSLSSDYLWNSPNPGAPTWCINEDDYHHRIWSGSLSGSFVALEQLCDTNVDYSAGIWWDAGGIGLQADLYVVGTLSDLTITSPRGDAHHAVLVGSSTSKGVTTTHYQACYVPPFSITYNIGGTPLPGGAWPITLSGSIAKATLSLTAEMADTTFQQQRCPPSEQNLFVW